MQLLPPPAQFQPAPARRRVPRILAFLTLCVLFSSFALKTGEAVESGFLPAGYKAIARLGETFCELRQDSRPLPFPEIAELPASPSGAEAAETEVPPKTLYAPDGSLKIVERDFSGSGLSNETEYTVDCGALLNSGAPNAEQAILMQAAERSQPLVLILHTHGSEAYADEGADSYPADSGMRSQDIRENVVAVGEEMTGVLTAAGIPTLHLTEMFDAESYYQSYSRSLEAVKECLRDYPGIAYIFDVHRDASADTARGIAYKPVTEIGGEKCAQLMFVVGTDFLGAAHPAWKTNLTLALRLDSLLDEVSPSLTRPINLRGASFNQQISPGFLLLEVGSCANTLSEAKRSGRYFAEALARYIVQAEENR